MWSSCSGNSWHTTHLIIDIISFVLLLQDTDFIHIEQRPQVSFQLILTHTTRNPYFLPLRCPRHRVVPYLPPHIKTIDHNLSRKLLVWLVSLYTRVSSLSTSKVFDSSIVLYTVVWVFPSGTVPRSLSLCIKNVTLTLPMSTFFHPSPAKLKSHCPSLPFSHILTPVWNPHTPYDLEGLSSVTGPYDSHRLRKENPPIILLNLGLYETELRVHLIRSLRFLM